MDSKKCEAMSEKKNKKLLITSCATVAKPFRILTTTILSLLLPISFLHLARLSTERYLLTFTFSTTTSNPSPQPFSLLFSIFHYANSALLHLVVSLVSLTALIHGLTSQTTTTRVTSNDESSISEPAVSRSCLYHIWIFVCTLQVCIGLWIEVSIDGKLGSSAVNLGYERSLLTRFVFFLGLHETMLHWTRMVVMPMVSDTVLAACGEYLEERWVQRVAMAASLGGLWWWRLRDEVESLVFVAEIKNELLGSVGVVDFVAWWLYHITVTIGMIRVLKGLVWMGMILIWRRVEENPSESQGNDDMV